MAGKIVPRGSGILHHPLVADVVDHLGQVDGNGDLVEVQAVVAHEDALLAYGTAALGSTPGLTLIGTAKDKVSVLSFVLEDIHPHDIGTILDRQGIAIRTGHHCAQPLMLRFGIPATARASLAVYNTTHEIDALVAGIHKVQEVFA